MTKEYVKEIIMHTLNIKERKGLDTGKVAPFDVDIIGLKHGNTLTTYKG